MKRVLLTLVFVVLAACGENRTIPEKEAYVAPSVAPLECVPNLDGRRGWPGPGR